MSKDKAGKQSKQRTIEMKSQWHRNIVRDLESIILIILQDFPKTWRKSVRNVGKTNTK